MIVRVITDMNKWIAEFELEDGDTMPEHMELIYNGGILDFHCRPISDCKAEDCRSLKDIKELIERKANALDGVPISDGGGACIGIYFSIVNDLPSVAPKSDKPSGKWIITEQDNYRIWTCHCSECGKDPQYYIGGTENWWISGLPKFCPNCGCMMKSEDKG